MVLLFVFVGSEASATPRFGGGQVQRLEASPARSGFGISVDVLGDTLLVGSVTLGKEPAEAFVFKRQGAKWVQVAVLAPPVQSTPLSIGQYPVQVALGEGIAAVRCDGRVFFYEEEAGGWRLLDGGEQVGRVRAVAADQRRFALLDEQGVLVQERSAAGWTAQRGVLSHDRLNTPTALALRGERLVVGVGCGHFSCDDGGEVLVLEQEPSSLRWVQRTRGHGGAKASRLGFGVAWAGEEVLATAPFEVDDGQRVGTLSVWGPGQAGLELRSTLAGRQGALGGPVMAAQAPSLGAFGEWAVVGLHFDRATPLRGGYALLHRASAGWETTKVWSAPPSEPHAGCSASMNAGVAAVGSPRMDGSAPGAVWVLW